MAEAAPRGAPPTQGAPDMLDPVCGALVPPDRIGAALTREDGVYSFCSEDCMAIFETNPEKYAGPGHVRVVDPVCGRPMWLGQTLFHFQYRGEDYRFCGEECYDRFTLDPEDHAYTPEFA